MQVDRLRLLASAVAGRALEVAETESGEPAWTDGATVYLDAAAPHGEQLQALAVQASLLAAGSLEVDIARQLHRHPALARRYLAVEGHRALAANEALLPPVVLGALDRVRAARSASPEESLALARSRQAGDDAPPVFGTIQARRLVALLERTETARALAAPAQASPGNKPLEALVGLDDGADSDAGIDLGPLRSSPVGGGGAVGRLLRRLLSPARARDGGGPPGADAPTHRSARSGVGRRAAVSGTPRGSLEGAGVVAGTGTSYPEWDVHRSRYRADWCRVTESDPTPAAGQSTPLIDDLGPRRPLARLGIGLDRCRRQRQGDDIDIDAAVQTRVDVLAGGDPGQGDVYLGSLRRRRDLAVLVLLDVSGSAGEPGTAGKPVHEHQRRAAAALVAALHGLGDRVALHAFNSRGRQSVQLLRVKAFDDHLDSAAAQRLRALTPGAYTRLGAAIRHGTTILEERAGTPRRLLVVLSDGFAYDHGYEGRYGEADARRALLEARRRGVGCVCLSVGTDAEPMALQRVFGTAAHASVPRTEQLPQVIGPLFRAALRSAEVHRRAFQRTERTTERLELERRADGRNRASVLRAGR